MAHGNQDYVKVEDHQPIVRCQPQYCGKPENFVHQEYGIDDASL